MSPEPLAADPGDALLDALPIVAFRAGADTAITYRSRGWQQLTGLSAAELQTQRIIHPDDYDRVAALWATARATGSSHRAELRIRFSDGSYHWMLSKADTIRDAAGAVTGWFGTVTGIDDLKAAQAALAESEATYRAFAGTIPGVTWAASPAGELTFVGDRWSELHGRPSEGALGDSWVSSLHPDDVARVRTVWSHSLATGEPYDIQFRVRVLDQSYRWFLVRALPVRADDGTILRWAGVNVDIDDQRRADEEREQFVRLVEASDDFIGIGDAQGNATFVNQAGRRMLGIGSSDDIRATTIMEYFTPDDRAFVTSTILPAVERDGRWLGEFRLRHFQTGEPIPFSYNVFSLPADDGGSPGIATVSRDLRDRHRFEAGLRALAETGAAMFRSLDFDQTVRNAAEAATRSFATTAIVDILTSDRTVRRVAVAHRASTPGTSREYVNCHLPSDHPIMRALFHGVASLTTGLPPEWDAWCGIEAPGGAPQAQAMLCAPIASAGSSAIIGALTCILDRGDMRGTYVDDDLLFAEELAGRIGTALDHVRAYEHERRIAVTLQEASLPGTLPVIENVSLSADYRPGNSEATIGGDWYDAFLLDDGRLAITIGDVLGNGLGAAVTMGKVRTVMQSVGLLLPDPTTMLAAADRTVRAQPADTYATALAGIYDPRDRTFAFASAGHPGPVLQHADGRIEELTAAGMMLGLRPGDASDTVTVSIEPGSLLVFYTDGLVEATRDPDQGLRRVHAALRDANTAAAANPARALAEHVLRRKPATDDLAVLIAIFGTTTRD